VIAVEHDGRAGAARGGRAAALNERVLTAGDAAGGRHRTIV
jgi:hypothetical protein